MYKYTVKRVDGKLRQPDRMTQYSCIRGTEEFFDRQSEVFRRVTTMRIEYFDAHWPSVEFPNGFPVSWKGEFYRVKRQWNFPTAFRQGERLWTE
jgi:hypothetical protein